MQHEPFWSLVKSDKFVSFLLVVAATFAQSFIASVIGGWLFEPRPYIQESELCSYTHGIAGDRLGLDGFVTSPLLHLC